MMARSHGCRRKEGGRQGPPAQQEGAPRLLHRVDRRGGRVAAGLGGQVAARGEGGHVRRLRDGQERRGLADQHADDRVPLGQPLEPRAQARPQAALAQEGDREARDRVEPAGLHAPAARGLLKQGKIKVLVGVCKGKKQYDKRQDQKRKTRPARSRQRCAAATAKARPLHVLVVMQHGRDHEDREQKFGTRIAQRQQRSEEPIEELDRRAKSTDPAPTEKGVEAERERHRRQGTTGGNVDPKQHP